MRDEGDPGALLAYRPPPGEVEGEVDAENGLALMERRVAAQTAALAAVPLNMRVPRSVIALLASSPGDVDGTGLPARCLPRLVALLDQVQALIDNVTLRERELGGRLATVRAARRVGPAAHLLDCRG